MSEQRISRELCKDRRSTEQVSLLPHEVTALHIHRFLVAPSSSRKGFAAINPILWPVCRVTDTRQDFNKVTAWCKTTGSQKEKEKFGYMQQTVHLTQRGFQKENVHWLYIFTFLGHFFSAFYHTVQLFSWQNQRGCYRPKHAFFFRSSLNVHCLIYRPKQSTMWK